MESVEDKEASDHHESIKSRRDGQNDLLSTSGKHFFVVLSCYHAHCHT